MNIERTRERMRRNYLRDRDKIRLRYKKRYHSDESFRKKIVERSKRWHMDNKEKSRDAARLWRKKNPEKSRARRMKFYYNNVEKMAESHRRYMNSVEGCYSVYKSSVKRRGLSVSLTIDEFRSFLGNPCHYCGGKMKKIGLDRVNNKIGYTKENSVSCCHPCNSAKSGRSKAEFVSMCNAVVRNHPQ